MNSELDILKKILNNSGKASIGLISSQSGLGLDYTNFICKSLLQKEKIQVVKNKPGRYRITARGKKELRLLGIIKPRVLRKINRIKKIPRDTPGNVIAATPLKSSPIEAEEKKLNLGRSIFRAVSFLLKIA